ncbi:MAG: MmoB/DmpM family protein [Panacagrimonas sp.]
MQAGTDDNGTSKNSVGPVLRSGELADAVAEAAREDNPGRLVTVEDHSAYVRVKVDHECVLQRETIERHLGRPFAMSELQADLASIAGQLEVDDSRMRFYFTKTL